MKKKKESFAAMVRKLPGLKKVADDDARLPGYFDTQWDIKYGSQVYQNLYGILENEEFYKALARYGYDAQDLRDKKDEILLSLQQTSIEEHWS